MTIEEELLQEYEKKLLDLYARANTKSKKKKIVYDLFNFASICYDFFGIDKTYEWDYDPEMISLLEDIALPFADNIIEDREDYLEITNSVINTFIETKYNFYKDHGIKVYSLSPYEIQQLTFDFLNHYDEDLLKRYREKILNQELFDISMITQTGFAGATYPMQGLKKSLIFCDDTINSLFGAATFMHELGHSDEYETKAKCGYSDYATISSKSPYQEVSSRFLEYAFLKYLQENKIYTNDTKITLRYYYTSMLEHLYCANLICKTPFININRQGFTEINDACIASYARTLQEGLNYYDMPSELGEQINFRNSFIYGIGSLFSIYLYEKYKEEPKYFKKEFRNTLINYPYTNIEAFENVGVTKEKIVEGKILKKIIKDIGEQ